MKSIIKKINIFVIKISLLLFVLILCCCAKNNEQKKEFIKNNIKKTNEKIEKKYGEIIIPDFLKMGELKLEEM